jgi:hypothetical protein
LSQRTQQYVIRYLNVFGWPVGNRTLVKRLSSAYSTIELQASELFRIPPSGSPAQAGERPSNLRSIVVQAIPRGRVDGTFSELNYSSTKVLYNISRVVVSLLGAFWWVREDSNLLSTRQGIYSPPQLTVVAAHPNCIIWCRMRESNSHQRITKPLYCHCTNAALLVDPKRIELLLSPCKGDMLPLSSKARYWHQCKDLNPDKRFWRPLCYRYTTLINSSQGLKRFAGHLYWYTQETDRGDRLYSSPATELMRGYFT